MWPTQEQCVPLMTDLERHSFRLLCEDITKLSLWHDLNSILSGKLPNSGIGCVYSYGVDYLLPEMGKLYISMDVLNKASSDDDSRTLVDFCLE